MFPIGHILFPFDFSAASRQAAPFVGALARRVGARVTLYGVVPPAFDSAPPGLAPRVGDDPAVWKAALQSQLDQAQIEELAGLPVERVADSGDPALRAIHYAEAHAVDLIMMPTHGIGLFRSLVLGSVTATVLRDAPCPVWTAAHTETQHAATVPRTVLCTIDGTAATRALIGRAAGFAAACGATLTLLHVVEPITDWPALDSERARQEEYRAQEGSRIDAMVRATGSDAPLRVVVGEIVPAVAEEARQAKADLIVVGRGAIAEPFGRLRTHAFGIIQGSPCPVLSVV